MSATFIGSPNFTQGREGKTPSGVIIHWMDGTLESADSTFQNTSRQTSAHYGVENDVVHQYVDEANTAWHAGNWNVNLVTIGIEHSAQPGRVASDSTYESSARVIASAAQRWGFPINHTTVRPHSQIIATQCPGTMDLDRLINRANEILGTVSTPSHITPIPTNAAGTALVTIGTVNVRIAPHVWAPLAGSRQLQKGQSFDYLEAVSGDNVGGVSTWLKSTRGNYVWAGGTNYATTPVQPKHSGTVNITAPTLNVRVSPTTSSALSGVLMRGTAHYNSTVIGQNVTVNGRTSNVWLLSDGGHWFAAAGTNY